jgi:phosphatidylglycerophosphate synthase
VCAAGRTPQRQWHWFAGWWLSVAAMLDWHLGMVEGPAGEGRQDLSSADALTLTRLWMVPLLASAQEQLAFTSLIAIAGLTDTLDGPLARRLGPTRLGRDLECSRFSGHLSACVCKLRKDVLNAEDSSPVPA